MLSALEVLRRVPVKEGTVGSAATSFDVVGLGVSTLDLMMVVDEFPSNELVQRAHCSLLQGGGPIATAMVALSRLGCKTAMLDKLGDDWRGKLILEEFQREGVSTDHLLVAKERTSSIASILVRKGDGARTITYSPGDVDELSPSELPEKVISASRILHLNGRHLLSCLTAAQIARQNGVLVSFDGGAHRFNERLLESIRLCDICIVARQFAYSLSGKEELEVSASHILSLGPWIVVITAGAEGSWAFDQTGQCLFQPAFVSVDTVDTTGAGDAYHGAFLCGILNNYNLGRCAEFASAVAAINTQRLGGRSALPSFSETVNFLAEHG